MDNTNIMPEGNNYNNGYAANEQSNIGIVPQPIANAAEPTITTFNDLCRYKNGKVVTLPEFAEGQPFVARVTRPSLMVLVKTGKIPNQLMSTVTKLFDGDDATDLITEGGNAMADMYSIMEIICEASLLQPTYKEIKDAGMSLTDEQMSAIFSYAQTGATALQPFH